MPSARRASSFARLAASSSSLTRPTAGSLQPDADLGDLERALAAAGQRHLDGVALLVAQQRLADRRLVGQPLRRLGLGDADDGELLLLSLVVGHVDDRADPHDVRVEVGGVDDRRRAQALLDLGDPLLELSLLVLGVVVLGVLGDVPELASLLDALGDLAALGRLEVLELLLELLEPVGGEDDVFLHGTWRDRWTEKGRAA